MNPPTDKENKPWFTEPLRLLLEAHDRKDSKAASTQATYILTEATRLERERWINQPANQHDNEIRKATILACIEIVKEEEMKFEHEASIHDRAHDLIITRLTALLTEEGKE